MNKLISGGLIGLFVVSNPFEYARGEILCRSLVEQGENSRQGERPGQERDVIERYRPSAVLRKEDFLKVPRLQENYPNKGKRDGNYSGQFRRRGRRYDRKII